MTLRDFRGDPVTTVVLITAVLVLLTRPELGELIAPVDFISCAVILTWSLVLLFEKMEHGL